MSPDELIASLNRHFKYALSLTDSQLRQVRVNADRLALGPAHRCHSQILADRRPRND